MTGRLMADPARVMQAQIGFWQDYMTLWQTTTRRMWGLERPQPEPQGREPVAESGGWKQAEVFDFVKQSYLLCARAMQDAFGRRGTLTVASRQKADFYARHFVEAMSPRHFLLNSPEMLRRTAESRGENLLRGLTSLLSDIERGRLGLLSPTADGGTAGFELGRTVGATPGEVVHRTGVMELIQYRPSTVRVSRRPLLLVPPWLGKFYVLDLQPRNSFVRWAVAQGHTVFVVSWGGDEAAGFEDFLTAGVAEALRTIERLTGERAVDALGYGLGGTLLASAAAVLAAQGEGERVASLTLLAAMLDFEQAGELGVFMDEEQLAGLGEEMEPGERAAAAATHAMLRANDLIWSFVVNTFLGGNEAFPFDLLHWNSDGTAIPSGPHGFYLRHIYRDNGLAHPGTLEVCGVPVDLGRVTAPAYVLAAREDRIAPWPSCWRGMRLLGGEARFVLAGSGHLAGVINPPGSGRYSHWISREAATDPEGWFAGAVEIGGSWWPDWQRWVTALDRTTVPARAPEGGIEAAPGSLVRRTAA